MKYGHLVLLLDTIKSFYDENWKMKNNLQKYIVYNVNVRYYMVINKLKKKQRKCKYKYYR